MNEWLKALFGRIERSAGRFFMAARAGARRAAGLGDGDELPDQEESHIYKQYLFSK
jgi:hypothetical protein